MITIRTETNDDIPAVYTVNEKAFERPDEAELVDTLRRQDAVLLSLVADLDGHIVGHILFTPVVVETPSGETLQAVGIGPLAVSPAMQRKGIGSLLMRAGLEACARQGHKLVFLLGHPDYYPRFGFQTASRYGYRWEKTAPEEAFMVFELTPNTLPGPGGVVRFLPEFETAE